ncbi:MAG: helix-turn-helix transcriptional regulator [Hyphomicrobiales bacterium]|nr:helix-turn-helix transcriptional regulator [Hyphomicrobiales bacterium]
MITATEDQAAAAFAALGNRTRLRLYRLLVRAGGDGLNVGDIQKLLDIPASTLAHHLLTLTRAGLVIQHKQGREVMSRADYDGIRAITNYLMNDCCKGVAFDRSETAA